MPTLVFFWVTTTKYIYTYSTTVPVPSSELDPAPPPLSRELCPSPPGNQTGRGHTCLRVRRWGVPIRTTGEKAQYSVYLWFPTTQEPNHKVNKQKRTRLFLLSSDLGQRRTFPRYCTGNPPPPLLKYIYVTCVCVWGGGPLSRFMGYSSQLARMTARICGFHFVQFCKCKIKFKGTVPQDFQLQVFS